MMIVTCQKKREKKKRKQNVKLSFTFRKWNLLIFLGFIEILGVDRTNHKHCTNDKTLEKGGKSTHI